MALVKSFASTVIASAKSDKQFRHALLEEALNELLNGDSNVANILINYYISATLESTDLNDLYQSFVSQLRMILNQSSNYTTENLILIIRTIQKYEKIKARVREAK